MVCLGFGSLADVGRNEQQTSLAMGLLLGLMGVLNLIGLLSFWLRGFITFLRPIAVLANLFAFSETSLLSFQDRFPFQGGLADLLPLIAVSVTSGFALALPSSRASSHAPSTNA